MIDIYKALERIEDNTTLTNDEKYLLYTDYVNVLGKLLDGRKYTMRQADYLAKAYVLSVAIDKVGEI